MIIFSITVEAAVPTCLEAHVGAVHRLDVEVVDGTIAPQVGNIIVYSLSYGVVCIDVEQVPLVHNISYRDS